MEGEGLLCYKEEHFVVKMNRDKIIFSQKTQIPKFEYSIDAQVVDSHEAELEFLYRWTNPFFHSWMMMLDKSISYGTKNWK